jgi:hypothetical protein
LRNKLNAYALGTIAFGLAKGRIAGRGALPW